jgi:hypothetical protein
MPLVCPRELCPTGRRNRPWALTPVYGSRVSRTRLVSVAQRRWGVAARDAVRWLSVMPAASRPPEHTGIPPVRSHGRRCQYTPHHRYSVAMGRVAAAPATPKPTAHLLSPAIQASPRSLMHELETQTGHPLENEHVLGD